MARMTIRQKIDALNKATTSFRATKKKTISRICSVGVRHRWLKYPSFIAAFFFILFANAAFYISLWVILNKRLATGIAISLVAAIGLLVVSQDYLSASGMYRQTADEFTITVNDGTTGLLRNKDSILGSNGEADTNTDMVSEETEEREPEWYELIGVDFDRLRAVNSDIVGWIFFENEDISYPILQGTTDDEYINTTYEGKSSRAGSIFLESNNSANFEDFHTLIYGHNMRNLSMFGRLRYYYQKSNYIDEHKYFQVITPERSYRYEIVAYKHVAANDPIYRVRGIESIGYTDFVNGSINNGSMMGMSIMPLDSDHFITLSTCASGDTRFVVSAIRIAESPTY